MQLGFDPLSDPARKSIWEINFERLRQAHEAGRVKLDWVYGAKDYVFESKEVRGLELNGREIRNGEPPDIRQAVQHVLMVYFNVKLSKQLWL